jgi:hypothetical protein
MGKVRSPLASSDSAKRGMRLLAGVERQVAFIAERETGFRMPKNRFEEGMKGLELSHEVKQNYPISPYVSPIKIPDAAFIRHYRRHQLSIASDRAALWSALGLTFSSWLTL